jgi:hypothetical protein
MKLIKTINDGASRLKEQTLMTDVRGSNLG